MNRMCIENFKHKLFVNKSNNAYLEIHKYTADLLVECT